MSYLKYQINSIKCPGDIAFYERGCYLSVNCSKSTTVRIPVLTLLHSEQPKLYGGLAVLSAIGLNSTEVNG